MLRPDRMSKVSVTGAKSVMPSVIETLHELTLVHLSEYDGSWPGFDNGAPLEGAEDASEKLVTVRSIKDALEIEGEQVDGIEDLTEAELETRLREVQSTVNNLDDQRNDLQDQIRSIDEQIETLEPFATLGIDLDLLWGYDRIDVVVGEGNHDEITQALREAEAIDAFETFRSDDVIAVAADGTGDDPIGDALVGVPFTLVEVPRKEGSPKDRIEELRTKRRQLKEDVDAVEEDIAAVRDDVKSFVLAAERHLTVQVERTEVPLQFATTKRSFIAEGWIPTAEVDRFTQALHTAVGERIEVEEVERAEYESIGNSEEAAADGGQPVTVDETPPTRMNNGTASSPFETLVRVVAHPKYSELDPTLIIFLTFPFMFGFMIGDIAYGLLYMAIGYTVRGFGSDIMSALGNIAMWCGGFTAIFGYLYNDFLGMKLIKQGAEYSEPLLPGLGLLHKGYKPGLEDPELWVLSWIILAVVFGVIHMIVGWYMNYVNERSHSTREALLESGSWIMAVVGLYLWLFSEHLAGEGGSKPAFIAGEEALWFIPSIPTTVGFVGLGMVAVGVVLVAVHEGFTGVVEIPSIMLGQTLSYLRIPAVLLAKGGMAMVVLILSGLVLGADPLALVEGNSIYGLLVGGHLVELFPGGNIVVGVLLTLIAVVVFLVGHTLVLLLGITAAGIQMLRLEYVEFFQRFYEGGGRKYEPFGRNTSEFTDD